VVNPKKYIAITTEIRQNKVNNKVLIKSFPMTIRKKTRGINEMVTNVTGKNDFL